jgi:K(+)-stimulated pyrophosphate-energized sodium pump
MSLLAMGESAISLSSEQLTYVAIVAAISVAAIGVAGLLVRQVLAASEGTAKMQEIAKAVQEGASAYLTRQFRTLSVFAVVVFFVLFLLPADTLGGHRLRRHVAGRPGQRARRRRGERVG